MNTPIISLKEDSMVRQMYTDGSIMMSEHRLQEPICSLSVDGDGNVTNFAVCVKKPRLDEETIIIESKRLVTKTVESCKDNQEHIVMQTEEILDEKVISEEVITGDCEEDEEDDDEEDERGTEREEPLSGVSGVHNRTYEDVSDDDSIRFI